MATDQAAFPSLFDGADWRAWTDDDNRMSYAADALTECIEANDPDSRKARLLHAARELVLMAAEVEQ